MAVLEVGAWGAGVVWGARAEWAGGALGAAAPAVAGWAVLAASLGRHWCVARQAREAVEGAPSAALQGVAWAAACCWSLLVSCSRGGAALSLKHVSFTNNKQTCC